MTSLIERTTKRRRGQASEKKKSYCYDKKRNSLREQIEFSIELSIHKYTRTYIKKSRVASVNVSVFLTM